MDDEPLSAVVLELADTRPTMVWLPFLGAIPVTAAGMMIALFGILMSLTGTWLAVVPAIPVWWGGGRLIALDYHIFTRLDRWLATTAFSWDAGTEGGASVSPGLDESGVIHSLLLSLGIRRPEARGHI